MLQQPRVRLIIGAVLLLGLGAGVWAWTTSGREKTDDAQVDAHVTQMAARVGGTVIKVAVEDNQLVEAGALLIQLDPGDYQVAVDKARAELADAEANAVAAQSSVPITSTTAASNVTTARGGITQAQSGVLALRRDCAKQQAGDRKHQHQQLEYGEIGRVVTYERGEYGKRQLDRYQSERDARVSFPHSYPDDW